MQKTTYPRPTPRQHSRKRQTVQVSLWISPAEKKELARVAESDGLSVSRTGRAIMVDGLRQRLRLEREVLAQPILEAFFEKKMNQVMNRLAEFLGRSVYEAGQMRWLFINFLYRQVLNPNKQLTKEEFYYLLDTSQKETIKAIRRWNPNIQDVVTAIKDFLKEEEEET